MKARLPARYSIPANKQAAFDAAVQEEAMRLFRQYESYATDTVNMAHMLVLIEQEGWGTGKGASKLPRHMDAVLKTIEDACGRYGYDCAIVALRARLRSHGVEYEGRTE